MLDIPAPHGDEGASIKVRAGDSRGRYRGNPQVLVTERPAGSTGR